MFLNCEPKRFAYNVHGLSRQGYAKQHSLDFPPAFMYSCLHRCYSGLRLPVNHLPFSLFGCPAYRHTHTLNGIYRLSPVAAPLLYCMNCSLQHRRSHASSPLSSAYVLTSNQTTVSSHEKHASDAAAHGLSGRCVSIPLCLSTQGRAHGQVHQILKILYVVSYYFINIVSLTLSIASNG